MWDCPTLVPLDWAATYAIRRSLQYAIFRLTRFLPGFTSNTAIGAGTRFDEAAPIAPGKYSRKDSRNVMG
jgi:hypothetical protein